MLVLASNQPEQFDWAINDRMDELVYFDVPKKQERERMIRHYFDLFLLQPSMDKKQRIRLADGIDYAAKCGAVAARTDGLSGRELSKVAIAWQVSSSALRSPPTAAHSTEEVLAVETTPTTAVHQLISACMLSPRQS